MSKKILIGIVCNDAELMNKLDRRLSIAFDIISFQSPEQSTENLTQLFRSRIKALLVAKRALNSKAWRSFFQSHWIQQILQFSQVIVLNDPDHQEAGPDVADIHSQQELSIFAPLDEFIVQIHRAMYTHKSDEIWLDVTGRTVRLNGNATEQLTGKEFALALALYDASPFGLTKEYLIRSVWPGKAVDPGAMSVHLCSLRKKLKSLGVYIHFDRSSSLYRIQSSSMSDRSQAS